MEDILKSGGIDAGVSEKAKDFLLYYGVLGIRTGAEDHFIYTVNYDSKMLKIRAERTGDKLLYVVNPALWPAFGFKEGD